MSDGVGALPEDDTTVRAHLRDNCGFHFSGGYSLRSEALSFYRDTYLCRLQLHANSTLKSGRRTQVFPQGAEFWFLFHSLPGDQRLIPLSNDRSNILLANRWFELKIRDDRERLGYARFYYSMCRVERRGEALNIPDSIEHVRFAATATSDQRSMVLGAMWRFLDAKTRSSLAVRFEEKGAYQWRRFRAYVPAQLGAGLFDVELKIWDRNGHITYNKSLPIYEGAALEGISLPRLGKIPLPGYIRWPERLLFLYQKARATLAQTAYAASTIVFVLASIACALFLLEFASFPLLRLFLDEIASLIGLSSWRILLTTIVGYCAAYFVLTTTLILDVDTIRGTLLKWVPRIEGTGIDRALYEISRKQHRYERGYKPPLWKRLLWSCFLLVFWSLYLIIVFTVFDASLQKHVAPDTGRMLDVAILLLEQALLYIPMVVYYAGWSFLDPQKLVIMDPVVLTMFRLIIGLLVVRRIHRFWAATASGKLQIKTTAIRHKAE